MNKPRLDTVPPQDLKHRFETALGELLQVQAAGQALTERTTSTAPLQLKSEKRAVSDAASALARLWKISPHPAR